MKSHPFFAKKKRLLPFQKHEKALAIDLKGRRTPASGAIPVAALKGDVITEYCMVEAKCTEKQSYILRRIVLDKLLWQAMQAGKTPVFALKFCDEVKQVYQEQEWFMLPKSVFLKVMEQLNGKLE